MTGSMVLDVFLVLLLLSFFAYGYRSGLVRSAVGIAGTVAGGVAAFFLVPIVGSWVPDPQWRTPAAVATAALLLLGGLSIGSSLGYALRRRVRSTTLRRIDRLLGAGLSTVVSALMLSLVGTSIGALGVPVVSPAIALSTVIRSIDTLTPIEVKVFLAQLRSAAVAEGIPSIVEAFQGPTPVIPDIETGSPALDAASRSVVRITGNAYACGQNQSGSGWVVSDDRVVTNAHVVAGVSEPMVESPGVGARPGRVVYFDPVKDLAVIAVDGLDTPALERSGNLDVGAVAVADGYPYGGPFSSGPAEVISVGTLLVNDIYGQNPAPREVYTLAADVRQGESGGPVLTESGIVAGVIFAKSADTADVGYALAMDEVEPVALQAPDLEEPVSSGSCTTA